MGLKGAWLGGWAGGLRHIEVVGYQAGPGAELGSGSGLVFGPGIGAELGPEVELGLVVELGPAFEPGPGLELEKGSALVFEPETGFELVAAGIGPVVVVEPGGGVELGPVIEKPGTGFELGPEAEPPEPELVSEAGPGLVSGCFVDSPPHAESDRALPLTRL